MRQELKALTYLFVFATAPLSAQWLKYKTPGIPRAVDGKPNLTAPAPRTHDGRADLSGLWMTEDNSYWVNLSGDLKPDEVRPWAAAVYKQRTDELDRDTPATHCLPFGPSELLAGGFFRIMQAPGMVAILSESGIYRQVFLDGRPLPQNPNPTWMGYSIGHWEGETLVVESAGFNDRTWLDYSGHPHSEGLRVTERFRRTDFGHMRLEMTFDDPKTFTRPFTVALNVRYAPDTEMLETVCNENERDTAHLVGKAGDEVKGEVKVSGAVLSRYAGAYHSENLDTMTATIAVRGDELIFAIGGKGSVPLTILSETSFYFPGGFPIRFVKEKGGVWHFLLSTAEGDMKFVRAGEGKPR